LNRQEKVVERVVVTGGSGKLGRWTVKELLEAGYEVVNVDCRKPEEPLCRTIVLDLTNLGEVYGALVGAGAVIHLAAIPSPGGHPNEVVYRNNVLSTFDVLEAAAGLGIGRVVVASSESIYGYVFPTKRTYPQYVPVDEEHPLLPQDCYALSKLVNEHAAAAFHRRTGIQFVSLRFGNIVTPQQYKIGFVVEDTKRFAFILWSYIDARDAAVACRMGIEKEGLGAVAINIVADENRMNVKSRDLMREHYPETKEFRRPLGGYESLLSNERARDILGWKPAHRWRDLI
jgi:nucleoside-diphosphate-sugar epimerase